MADNLSGERHASVMRRRSPRRNDGRTEPPYSRIDRGIRRHVRVLFENGIETIEACQGGRGHAFYEPTVRFVGGQGEGFRALAIALQHGLKVSELRRYYSIQDGEPHGPAWEMTFVR